ncbi:MAG: DUF374 domain-containing protein [Acidobacteria bacterium]|nr:DUF374 domain-containing protein [Acidobacteriota bacterium]
MAGFLGALAIRLARRLMRLRYVNREVVAGLRGEGRRFILAFWHGQLFLMPYAYPGGRIAVLISRHRDGEYISRTLEALGCRTARGSSSSGGGAALRELVRRYREGYDLAVTPDGPRGPRHRAQPGVIQAARLTGASIVPVAFDCSKKNSCRPGTGSSCRCRSRRDTSPTARRSGSNATRIGPGWRRSGGNWSACSRSLPAGSRVSPAGPESEWHRLPARKNRASSWSPGRPPETATGRT